MGMVNKDADIMILICVYDKPFEELGSGRMVVVM